VKLLIIGAKPNNARPVAGKEKKMKFEERTLLVCDDNPNGSHNEELAEGETLLVGDTVMFSWDDESSQYGCRANELRPAFHNGEKAWLHGWDWHAQGQYCGEGAGEYVLDFKDGVSLLLKHGAYEWMFKADEEK
jgi:hypothetical protein